MAIQMNRNRNLADASLQYRSSPVLLTNFAGPQMQRMITIVNAAVMGAIFFIKNKNIYIKFLIHFELPTQMGRILDQFSNTVASRGKWPHRARSDELQGFSTPLLLQRILYSNEPPSTVVMCIVRQSDSSDSIDSDSNFTLAILVCRSHVEDHDTRPIGHVLAIDRGHRPVVVVPRRLNQTPFNLLNVLITFGLPDDLDVSYFGGAAEQVQPSHV